MDPASSTLCIRALNYWRPLYIPSYIGLRLFLDQVPRSKSSDFIQHFLTRKVYQNQSLKYRRFWKFKGFDSKRELQYRKFYAASPSSALSEARALNILSQVYTLQNKPGVFSYLWPEYEKAGSSYRYFYSGYSNRDRQVTAILRENPTYRVLVYDIKSFYPSTDREIVLKRLGNHLDTMSGEQLRERDYLGALCAQVLQIGDAGIPIGPALSHVFGNIALETIDTRMYELLGDRYLRYVDDIFLVVSPSELKTMNTQLRSLVEAEGLEFNQDKLDELTSEDWLDNLSTPAEQGMADRFSKLEKIITLFLWSKPSRLNLLNSEFKAAGIPMPVHRFATQAFYGRFQQYMKRRIWQYGYYRRIVRKLELVNEKGLVDASLKLSQDFYEAAQNISLVELRTNSIIRRRRIQRLRFLLNRLLYLLPIDQYPYLLKLCPEVDEFFEYRSLVEAMIERNVDYIMNIPGPSIQTFASLCEELDCISEIQFNSQADFTEQLLESICILSAYGIINPSSEWCSHLDQADAELVKFCVFEGSDSRVIKDNSYEDEVRSLQLGVTKEKKQKILTTKFDDLEHTDLEALLLSRYGSA